MYCKYFKFSVTVTFFSFVLFVPNVITSGKRQSVSSSPWRFPSSPWSCREKLKNCPAPSSPVSFNPRVWNGNVVPYNISSVADERDRRLIYGAIQEITENTCYRFKPRWSSENSYLDFVRGYSCQVLPVEINRNGQNTETRQRISLPFYGDCLTHNKASQLILSALGLSFSSSSLKGLPKFKCDW